MMGLETLLEAAKYLEYKAEVEARGEKGFPDLPSNGTSSVALPTTSHNNGFVNHGVVPNGIHYLSQAAFKSHHTNTSTSLPRVPEPVNGFKISPDHSYRLINQINQSPTFDFNGGTNRITKNNNTSLNNNRNSGTREVHNKLEKNRRAHLKECFELLKSQLPAFEDRKISNLAILRSSLRHIQTLKRKEREYEHEMERLAREKIALQQRLSTLKKDMLGKWDHLDWRAMIPEDLDVDIEGHNGSAIDTLSSEPLENHRSSESEPNSPSEATQPPKKNDMELEESSDSQYPLSLTVNNCHIGENNSTKKLFGSVNGINGISSTGPISLVTTSKLSSSPLAAITVEKTANSPIGGASYVNNTSGKGFSVLNNSAVAVSSKIEIGQYYDDEKMCK
jgi:MAX-binding protein